MSAVYIGTSGWSYKSWDKTFYPRDLVRTRQFEFYTTQFPTVEVNATFYRLPSLKMVRGWRDKSPPNFVFAIKGSRFITHMKKLKNLGHGLRKYFGRVRPLADKTAAVLWQLPPNLQKDIPRLRKFLQRLPARYRHAVEFRHPSWLNEETFELLEAEGAAFVSVSSLGMPMNLTVTADFCYVRFHGLESGAAHDYNREELKPWAEHIAACSKRGKNAYVYFNNDANVRAPANAHLLMEMVGTQAQPAFALAA